MHLIRAQWNFREQAFAQVGEIPVGMPRRCNSLVHLDQMHIIPGNVFVRQDT